jgi:hypothetical protein
MVVKAKFRCASKTQYESTVWDENHENPRPGFVYSYEFSAVMDGSEENKKFYASTPGGSITLSAVRDDLFVPGHYYYLDFTPAE